MQTTAINKTWEEWLEKERHISVHVAREAGLSFRGPLSGSIAIPVYALDGTWLFNKYRRSPILSAGPKYRYDAGATRALFGAEQLHKLPPGTRVIVTEGELDALALRTLGFVAVSSTGGAGTWSEDFADMLDQFDVVLFFDADEPGVRGMLNAATFMPFAEIAWMPVQYGKDSTDVIHAGAEKQLIEAIDEARKFSLPFWKNPPEMQVVSIDRFREELAEERKRILLDFDRTPFHIDIAEAWAIEKREKLVNEIFTEEVHGEPREGTGDIERARAYPMKKLVKVNSYGFARCPFHEDSTASLKIYTDNHGYCFGGCGRKSSIDIQMQNYPTLDKKEAFKQAVKDLANLPI